MIKIVSLDNITMKAKGVTKDGKEVNLRATYAFGPISFYDEDNERWLSSSEWCFWWRSQ